MTTYDFNLTLDDREIIALENLLKYVLETYSDNDAVRSKATLLVSQSACEDMLVKVKNSWGNLSLRSSSSFCDE